MVRVVGLVGVVGVAAGCGGDGADGPDWLIRRAGGETTTFEVSDRSFNLSARNLGLADRARFADGDDVFERHFTVDEGLGPDLNASACTSCHVDNGRFEGRLDLGVLDATGPVVHVSSPGATAEEPPRGLPGYGTRIQTGAIGTEPEALVTLDWEWIDGEYPDGTPFTLRRPTVFLVGSRGEIPADTGLSLRIPQHLAGTGLLQAITAADVLDAADPDDEDGDGISGRPNRVRDTDGSLVLGRFGWKAEQPDLVAQTAAALLDDLGITTSLTSAAEPELGDQELSDLAFYVEALAVPAGRDIDHPAVIAGARLFSDIGCATCHTPEFTTGVVAIEGLSGQRITPFTDLLLHDLGPGLADGRPVFAADGSEWRTAPLWGIGLLDDVNGRVNLLHDGRARTVEEAILWHGGEARATIDRFMALPAPEREQLLRFVDSR